MFQTWCITATRYSCYVSPCHCYYNVYIVPLSLLTLDSLLGLLESLTTGEGCGV